MANSIFEDLRQVFRGKDNMIAKIILVNVIVFVLFNVVDSLIFKITYFFALPGDFIAYITKFWTIISYMFLHGGLFHILFNMLWLYWIGKILVEYLGERRMVTVYFLGGIVGGGLFIVAHNILGLFGNEAFIGKYLIGASAGVMAVVFATSTLLPEYTIRLLLLGPVKMRYLAIGALVLTSILDFSVNTGGKIAHIGGAFFGYFFIKQLKNGADMSKNFYKIIDGISGIFSSKPKMRVYRNKETVKTNVAGKKAQNRTATITEVERQKITDDILDKISKSGYDSLSKEEKDFLFSVSKDN